MSDIGGKSRSAVTSAASGQSGLGPQPDTFREVRRNLDASVLPLATSVDGRRFSFQASLYGLVVLDPNSDFVRLAALTGSDHPVARRLGQSVTFRQGEGLIAGKISPQPALLRFGARISQEGGADAPATWAAAR